jgi:DNA helicase-2/ATP-dependent DNA helicase PcrA
MGRKKKEEKPIELSNYQLAIIDFIKNGQGNLVVEAAAGAGKTYTLIKCIEEIPGDKNILLTAFNSDIAKVLKRKAKDFYNVNVSTLHSLGRQMLQRNFTESSLELDEFKYKSYINTNIKSLSSINTYELGKRDFARYMSNIEAYINFGRAYLCQTVRDLDFIEDRYDIETIADEKEIALDALEYGKHNLEQIDYTDMIWLPNVLYCKPIGMQFDWIFLDEAQDLSVCQREILLKCRKINTRMCFFGDAEQSLYSFASSDPESFKRLKEIPNTTSLPLSISYRCARNIVDFARKIVPSIEWNNDGRNGEVKYDVPLSEVKDGDMVLCRNNAPLMKVYVDFIKAGKKCFIRGKDIGLNLKNMVKRTGINVLNKSLQEDGVFIRLYDALFDNINELIDKYHITYSDAVESSIVANKLDMIKALEILSDDINTADELIEKINNIFSDRKKGGISLSTVHKAKGLEAENVYIACRELMPSSRAKKDWEIRQEYNLMYVAYTRAKDILGFIDSKEFEDFNKKTSETVKALKVKEAQVNYVLKKERKKIDVTNPFIANDIIRHATKIEKPKAEYKVMPLMKDTSVKSGIAFNDIFKRRFIKR